MRCLVTGATGYIGGRLTPLLLADGHTVRCLARKAVRLRDVPWASAAEIVEGDLSRPETLPAAFADVDVAYFLVHSLGRPDFEAADRDGGDQLRGGGRARPAYAGSSTWAGRSRRPTRRSRPRTCGPGPRWAGSCWPAGCPRPCCGPR